MSVDPSTITLPIAVLAGFVSFISPCVLPLVPAYIGYLTGQATNTISGSLATAGAGGQKSVAAQVEANRWTVFLHGVFFVLGFSFIFVVVFGVTAGVIGELGSRIFAARDWLLRIGGLLVIVLGLHTMGVIKIPFLYADTRNQTRPSNELGYLGSGFMGITFAAGWSPCIGPILTAMLALGASTGSVGRAVLLLSAYALGLGIPFLVTALLVDKITPRLRSLQKHMRTIEIISGVLLIIVGVLIFAGAMQRLLAPLAGNTDFIIKIDEWLVNLAGGGG